MQAVITCNPIWKITVTEVVEPPPPPTDVTIIGITYDIDAGDATFENPVTITLTYDPADLPVGVHAEDLTLAWWDDVAEEWIELPTVVDPATNTITAEITHFSKYAIFASQPEEEPATPTPTSPTPVEKPPVEKPSIEVLPTPTAEPVNWALIWGIVGGIIVIGVIIWLVVFRRRARQA